MKYELRLGDIVRMFPACKLLADAGHEVDFYTYPQYKSIFGLISYARWVGSCEPSKYDRVVDPQIFPGRYHAYRASRKHWKAFVYGLYDDIRPALDHPIVFDRSVNPGELLPYGLPEEYVLISPFGHSQIVRPSVQWMLDHVIRVVGHIRNAYLLAEEAPKSSILPVITASSLTHLAPLIANAREFFTINSSPSIIASAVRNRYYHVYLPDYDGLDDFSAPSQIVLRQ